MKCSWFNSYLANILVIHYIVKLSVSAISQIPVSAFR